MKKVDYAIIGGGVAGLYCGWRLKQAYPTKNIVIFEFSNRIGGRLLSVKIPDTNLIAELGGMRYNPDEHKIFHKLVDELDLKWRPFLMGTNDDPTGKKNLVYFRGKHFRVEDFGNSEKIPFKVRDSEKNKTPDQLQMLVLKKLIPNFQNLKPEEWFTQNVEGRPLWQHGFWNLLYRNLSPDAYFLLKYGSGYDTNVSNGNAVTLLPTGLDYSPEAIQFYTLVDGMEAFPKELAKQFEKKHKGIIRKNICLKSIKRRKDKNYDLRFLKTNTKTGKTTISDPQKHEDIIAEHVILAMPRAALELIEWDQWKKNKFLRENLGSVLIQKAMKIFLAYNRAWWKTWNLMFGRSLTDMPIRQTIYFTSLDDVNPEITNDKPALLLASYNDIETIPFWKTLEIDQKKFNGPTEYRATNRMVQEAHDQVKKMHDVENLDMPIAAAYKDWSDQRYGGGWHCWKANYNYMPIMEKMRHPILSEKVYICGEAYSNDQGWAEGSLETAELMLTKDIKVPAHKTTRDWTRNDNRRRHIRS